MTALRHQLALAGFLLAGLAAALDQPVVGWVALGLLGGALVLRFRDRRGSEPAGERPPGSDAPADSPTDPPSP